LGAGDADWSPARVLDAFSVLYVFLLLGLFLSQLPNNHMHTNRYLNPLYAIGVYWVVRLPVVRRVLTAHWRTVVGSYATTVLVGVPLYVFTIWNQRLTLGEAIQLYAIVALCGAAGLAIWPLLGASTETYDRLGGVLLGLCVGLMSGYLLVSGTVLHPTSGEFLLPISRLVSEGFHYWELYGSKPPFIPY
jgi:hypothetical protein